ncbi:YybH family protein [Microlunatus sp. GCM10028923]|uniref:YybH family protein n=1 Tax=Microlunatus sp. GCM10028923 TaxID=3273400 RepID=UPI00361E8883
MTRATEPGHLGPLLVEAINAGDLDGLVDLYEPEAALELPDGSVARGRAEIREFYAAFLAGRPVLTPGEPLPPLVVGDLALTNTRIGPDTTCEVARRQPDGSWRWLLDRPSLALGSAGVPQDSDT